MASSCSAIGVAQHRRARWRLRPAAGDPRGSAGGCDRGTAPLPAVRLAGSVFPTACSPSPRRARRGRPRSPIMDWRRRRARRDRGLAEQDAPAAAGRHRDARWAVVVADLSASARYVWSFTALRELCPLLLSPRALLALGDDGLEGDDDPVGRLTGSTSGAIWTYPAVARSWSAGCSTGCFNATHEATPCGRSRQISLLKNQRGLSRRFSLCRSQGYVPGPARGSSEIGRWRAWNRLVLRGSRGVGTEVRCNPDAPPPRSPPPAGSSPNVAIS